MLSTEKLMEKLDKPVFEKNPEEEKEKMDEIFATLPKNPSEGQLVVLIQKREPYLKMLNENKIKMPKTSTLQYYNIETVGDKYVLVM